MMLLSIGWRSEVSCCSAGLNCVFIFNACACLHCCSCHCQCAACELRRHSHAERKGDVGEMMVLLEVRGWSHERRNNIVHEGSLSAVPPCSRSDSAPARGEKQQQQQQNSCCRTKGSAAQMLQSSAGKVTAQEESSQVDFIQFEPFKDANITY